MSENSVTESEDQPSSDIMKMVESNPMLVLLHESTRDALFKYIDNETAAHLADLTTQKGRDATASQAFKIVRTKTAIEKAAVSLRAKVQTQKEEIVTKLDEKAKAVRKPLTDWEDEQKELERIEKERKAKVDAEMRRLTTMSSPRFGATSDELADMRRNLDAYEIDRDIFKGEGEESEAYALKNRGLEFLEGAIEEAEKREEEAAELERLREAERKRQEAEKAKQDELEASIQKAHASISPPTEEELRPPRGPGRNVTYIAPAQIVDIEVNAAPDNAPDLSSPELAEKLERETPNSDFEVEPEKVFRDVTAPLSRDAVIKEVAMALYEETSLKYEEGMALAKLMAQGIIPHVAIDFD